jgi:hypothetical protein
VAGGARWQFVALFADSLTRTYRKASARSKGLDTFIKV